MENAVRAMMAIALVVIGLSHILQSRAWVRFFVVLREMREAGVIATAFLHLWPGLLIVAFHNVWQGVPAILTVYGWLLVFKSTIYLLCPSVGLRGLALVKEEDARNFALAGALMVALGLLLGWNVVSSSM